MGRFEGKVALVTGAASGIGLATAERLAAEGARVVVADIDRAGGEAAAAKVSGSFVRLDVGDPAAWGAAIARVRSEHGGLDIAHLNAGVTTYPPRSGAGDLASALTPFDITTVSDDAYRRIMGANVDGVVYGVRAVVPLMEARGGGAIVATASVAGLIAFAGDPIYTATKHAVVGLVRSLAPALAAKRISIHAICPGIVDTNILGPGTGEVLRRAGMPVIDPAEIAAAVVGAIESGTTGEAFVCLAGRPPARHAFTNVDFLAAPVAR
jgi:NAD(P)-dependent dehydrogenase (short-subunit alcohol dehydrogenase family)